MLTVWLEVETQVLPLQQPPFVQEVESQTQLPLEHRCPLEQGEHEEPQWLVLERMSTQVLPPQSDLSDGQTHWLPEQVMPPVQSVEEMHCTQFPDRHLDVLPVQAWLQVPQLLGSEVLSTQLVPHAEVVLSHAEPQTLLVQVPTVCNAVVVHSVAEQHAGEATPMQVLPPAQVRWPLGHVPLHAAF